MSVTRLLLMVGLLASFVFTSQGQITVDFTADQTEGCGSLQVNFCDNSSSTSGSIVSWSWNLGGISSSSECQGRIFGSPGNYEICLTVTDSEGNSASLCEPNFITVHALPQPDFDATPVTGCIPLTSTFSYTGSSNITEFVWGVGGSAGVVTNNGSSSPAAESTYSIADDYSVSLTVTDDNGCVNFITKDDFISAYEPTEVEFHAIETVDCEPPFFVTFVNDNIQPGMTYFWDFGNGAVFTGAAPPPVWYNDSGAFTVTLIGENADTDCKDTLILEDYINIGYTVDFSSSTTSGCEDLTVNFIDESLDAADAVSWDFGDGSAPSTAANPSHVYETPGIYSVTLTRDIAGCLTEFTSPVEIEVFALPDVAYNNDNTLGCSVPHSVNFTGVSSDAISWLWDFGDGTTSTSQNPNHVYTNFGNYEVSLTVTSANGCENVISTTTIEIIETQAQLTNTTYSGCTPLTVNLVDSSITVVPINSWTWEINTPSGVLTSNDANPSFSIPDTGCFDLTLTVMNVLGCSDTQTFPGAICVGAAPLPNFDAIPTVACIDEDVNFTDLSSPFVDFWAWDFGNGKTSGQQNPSVTYLDTGFYDVTLTVIDNGCIDQLTIPNFIEVTAPRSRFFYTQDCNDPFTVVMTNTSIEADSFYWDFGIDGIDTDTSTAFEPTFTYPDTGTFFITLTTFNFTTGCEHEFDRKIFIHDPYSIFTVSETKGCVPMTIDAINTSIHAAEYAWSGTGITFSNDSIANPTLTFNDAGFYTDLQLEVTDVNGCTHTTIFDDTIFVNEITVNFTPNDTGGCQPFDVTFNDNSSNLFGNNIQWDWVFENNVGTATGQTASHTFANLGKKKVSLTVTDDWGCSTNLTIPDAVEVTAPSASFTTDTLSCTDRAVDFVNNSTGLNLSYAWDFGDGMTSTDENPSHTYMAEGTFSPCLTVTDEYNCTNTFCLNNYVVISDPVASFTLDTSYASCPPLIVNFENTSSNATSYEWNYGDGSGLSNLENPSHVYTLPGVFDVNLIATSIPGCADTSTVQGLIVLDGPLGDFHYSIDTGCAPMRVTFFAESQGNFMYVWDFGDGSPLDTVENVSTDTTIYYYTSAGTFTPKLGIIDQIGCERILESSNSIFVPELTLDFQGTDTVLCDFNDPITFFNLLNSTGAVDSLSWVFEGGTPTTSTDFEPTVTFDLPGKYDVTLIAHNSYCSDTLTKADYVRIGDVPSAQFTVSDMSGCDPFDVTFTDVTTVTNGIPAQWHWKFGDGFESFVPQPTHTYTDGPTFEAKLIVTTDIGCKDSTTQTITVFPNPDLSITADQEICIGETTQLFASILSDPTGVTYFWENSPTLSCTDCLDPIANPVDTTVYTFVAINADGCESRMDIQIDVRPFFAPVIDISNDTIMCAGDVVQLFVDGGIDIFSYEWDNTQAGLSCYDNCLNPIASPEVSTTYTVTVTNSVGCSSMDTVRVSVINQHQEFAGEDRTICLGDTAHLSISLGNNPLWLVSNGLDCSTCFEPVASPQVTTDFVAQTTTTDGCEIIDTVRVNVLTQQDIYAGEDMTLCEGESVLLDGQFLHQDSTLTATYAWTPAGTLDNPTLQNPEAFPTQSTTYNLSITSGDCTLRDSLRIDLVTKTEIEVEDYTVCEGGTAQVQAIGAADNFRWIPAEGLSDPNIANPIVTPTESTTYTVIASLAACEPDTATSRIEINELPGVEIAPVHTILGEQPMILNIENASSDYTYEWLPADGLSCTDCPNPTVLINQPTIYWVTVTDLFTGCQVVLNTKVVQQDFCSEDLIGVPNAFTPNGDGFNEDLVIKYSSSLIVDNFKMRIFDRWGGLLFETSDINERWDGTSGGQKVPAGVVIYFMEFPCHLNGAMIQKTGDITIYR